MGADWVVGQGDTAPAIATQLRDDPAWGDTTGVAVDLADATQIVCLIRSETTKQTVAALVATVVDRATGQVQIGLPSEVTANRGLYAIRWQVTWSDGSITTYPSTARRPFQYLLVRGAIVSDSIPTPPVATGSGPAPLFIADGATGQVTGNGQVVLAGANATITVLEGIRSFTVAEWSTQTPWAAGTTPTVTQTATTVDASVAARLLDARGDLVTLVSSGTVWYSSTSVDDAEVGEGDTLPPDASEWELFRLVGTPDDGLFAWSEDAQTWIEA